MNQLHYKDYTGDVFFSEEDGIFHGKVIDLFDSISFEGESVKSLTEDFHNAVDEYLEFCADNNKERRRRSFSINISPEIYNMAAACADQKGLPLNIFVENLIKANILPQRSE